MAAGPLNRAQPRDENLVHVFLDRDFVSLGLEGLLSYQQSLRAFQQLEAPFDLAQSPITREIETLGRLITWCRERLREAELGTLPPFMDLTWRTLRWLKTGILMKARDMEKAREEVLQNNPVLPVSMVDAINARIAEVQNLAEQGAFNGLNPIQLTIDTLPPARPIVEVQAPQERVPIAAAVPRMRVELIDKELRQRCADLLEQFSADPDQNRFDTVLREASTVLENRIRANSGLPANVIGLDLVSRAFNPDNGELILSDDRPEQEGAHLLYRGYFAFVRNAVGHRLVPTYTQERAVQVLGLVDYLLFLLSRARRRNPPPGDRIPAP